jgi:hypothetical protein
MLREEFLPKLIVRNEENGFIGVTYDYFPKSRLNENEVAIISGCSDYHSRIDCNVLEIIGPENAVPHVNKCGFGRGEDTCIFLNLENGILKCERFGDLRFLLLYQKKNAKRKPKNLFPHCQLF